MTKPLILWVEDNPDDVVLMRQAFAEADLPVDFVVPENAVLAYRYMLQREPYRLSRHPPDLILIDLNLPVVPGERVIQEVRRFPPWAGIPVVVLTSSADADELDRCVERGATECVTKPPTFDGYVEIAMRLQAHIDRSRAERA